MNIDEIIDDDKIQEMYKKIKPIVTIDEAKYLLKKFTLEEIKTKSFLKTKKEDKDIYIDNSEIKLINSFDFIKKYNNPLSFNPTISDVLNEMLPYYYNEADAFEVNDLPKIYNDCHLTEVKLYKIIKK